MRACGNSFNQCNLDYQMAHAEILPSGADGLGLRYSLFVFLPLVSLTFLGEVQPRVLVYRTSLFSVDEVRTNVKTSKKLKGSWRKKLRV